VLWPDGSDGSVSIIRELLLLGKTNITREDHHESGSG